ncbi:V-type ATP synthase subunit I [Candidatus Nitrosocosmicus arcticus]|uniref:A-type ATP synthase subunit I n=1 Tax=Candidatus Nitrosocosmicus arcticus TaxID=2035267 RepID=A0A557SWU6_9ARCH|nr:V-type ATP synthase subunit I [Candidatus Nitrosocosmicus arcticus]TVP41077.1 archaeal A1A0-type ATP synthase, subunit I [Candidatus Nitrosocosmicus arcticus]
MTLLRPEAMSKIAVLGLKKYRQQIVSILQEMSVIQIEQISKEISSYLSTEKESDAHRHIADQLIRIRGLLSALPPTSLGEKIRFSSIDEMDNALLRLDIDKNVASLEREKENILTEIRNAQNNIKLIGEFSFFPEDLDILHLKSARSFFGRIASERYSEFKKKLESNNQDIVLYSKGGEKITEFVLVVLPRYPSNALASIINLYNVHMEAVPPLKGKPQEVIENLMHNLEKFEKKLANINSQLLAVSQADYSLLKGLEEQLDIENKKLEVIDNLGVTWDTFTLEGWIPKSMIENTKAAVEKHSKGTMMFVLNTNEVPPTLQDNPKRLRVYESFIRFYSLPSGNEFDPTLVFALVFPVFYGMMFADVGYAIVILLVSRWVIRRVEGGKKNFTIMPKFLRNFGKTILQPTQMVKIAKAITPGCIIAIVLGFCFNLYFGFHLNEYVFAFLNSIGGLHLPEDGTIFDPLSTFGLRKLLLISGYVGLGMVSFGFILGIINDYSHGNKRHAIGKIGWLMFGWGVVFIGLGLIGHENINPMASVQGALYFALIFGGIGLMFYGEGTRAMMELPSIISHILSFTRLVGIMMASIILADVIDHVFLRVHDNGIIFALVGFIILIVGHLFNIILGVFEPGIQGARLLYVEFFSKFYHGNGRPFKPFGFRRRYTHNQYPTQTPK